MAVTGFWPVYRNLKATLDYADNPDKTTAPEYLDEDLYAALRYAENDDKTDRKMFVGGINCSAQNAYAEMIAVQRRFGLRGKVVGYHGIQSFREGEVTPEQAFAIGNETARRMWGDRYQVLVTVHLNTDNVHCHFVVNPVSFRDGSKFKNKIGDHKELRKISDDICREHELSVLENSEFYSKGKRKNIGFTRPARKPIETICGRMWNTACPLRPAQENLKVSFMRSGIPLTLCAFQSKRSIGSVPCG